MLRPIRSALRALRREFLHAADRHPDLFYEVVWFGDDTLEVFTDGEGFDGWTDEDWQSRPWCHFDSWGDVGRLFVEMNASRERKPPWEAWEEADAIETASIQSTATCMNR